MVNVFLNRSNSVMAIGSLEKAGYVLHVQKTDIDLHSKAAR
jgi:hypothetical protein